MAMKFLRSLVFAFFTVQVCLGYQNDIGVQLNDDVLGLIVFKSGIGDPFSHLSSWNEDDETPCSWKHIRCDSITGRVSELSLQALNLSGKVGKGLERLRDLKLLSLSGNNFSGELSPEKLALPMNSLRTLDMSNNGFSGNIPSSFANSSSIRELDLSGNELSGIVPESIFEECSSLRSLSFAGNSLEGPIPRTLSRCASLNSVNLSGNRFSGSVDFAAGIWSLSRLRKLDFSGNLLAGNIPRGISNLPYLKEFSVKSNQFSGIVPDDLGLSVHLQQIDLSENRFVGDLPESIQRLESLSHFTSSNNLLSGEFPYWIPEMRNIEVFDLSGNGFHGNLPPKIGEMKSLRELSLSNNDLSGEIPNSLGDCSELRAIHLNGNSFNGTIPEGLFDLALEQIDLSDNKISGPIPSGSSKMFESLRYLDLSMNNLEGNVPAEMGLFSNLEYLNMSWNNLHSNIPPEIGLFRNLTVLDLRKAGFFGAIPGDICDSGRLKILQLDYNSLTDEIPDEIGNCSSLNLLSLSHNNLSGEIPKSISQIRELKILRMEVNELSGEIPMELGKLQYLLSFNVSYNNLIGRLPSAPVFQSLDQSSLQGNSGICSPILKGPCKLNVPKPLVLDPNAYKDVHGEGKTPPETTPTASKSRQKTFLSVSVIVAIAAASAILIGVIVISLLNASARKRLAFVEEALESMCSSSSKSGNSFGVGKLVLFDMRTSLEGIENPVSMLNKASEIGEGVFGTVYKASIAMDGTELAIKRLVSSNIVRNPEDFDREVRLLAKAKHPNLLPLKGYYWTPQVQLLVTEFFPNGSLQSKLHERPISTPPLTWPTRFKILIGTAKGLAYLHHSTRPPIVHYSLKPSNILLDKDFTPKIADFGLARLLLRPEKHVVSNRFQSALGYVAPELACQSLKVNEKCDVYGFGVLILEVVSGKRPVEYGEDNVVILSDHVRVLLEEGNVLECVDRSMGNYSEDEVLPVLKLALVCVSQVPSTRPSMDEVVQILQVIKTPLPHRMEMF